jgi:TRAP-type mannitol/chloroaromatic compound transport system substrate-binding protein
MTARYDMQNPAALRRLAEAGAILRPFSESVLDACLEASNAVYAEIMATNADFRKTYEAMTAVRADGYLWFQLSEHTSDTYMMIQQRKGRV